MRVTVQIDDQGQDANAPEVQAEGQPQVTPTGAETSSAPPGDLAARASAMGAISAGPAPSAAALASGAAGAPAITAPAGDQPAASPDDTAAPAPVSAGAAPGQADPTDLGSEDR
jgi:hypothetical protein